MENNNREVLKEQFLEFINNNYDNVVKSAKGGEYIEIDLIPNSHDGLHDLIEILFYCQDNNINVRMFYNSYPLVNNDGLRMNRYFYYMQETTKVILTDLAKYRLKNEK